MEFNKRWKEAKDTSLYVPNFLKPKTQREFFLLKYWEEIEKVLKHESIGKVIDLGCGRGTMSQYLFHRMFVNQLTLVDQSQEALDLAKVNMEKTGIYMDGVSFKKDLSKIKQNSFTTIVSVGLLEHLEDPTILMKQQYKALQKGGLMIAIIMPQKKSRQRFNIFGKDKYFRTCYNGADYRDFVRHHTNFEILMSDNINPYTLFTPIPMWLDKLITKIYLVVDKFYSFNQKLNVCQAHILVCRK